ncbi:MAG: hypothetical protein HY701_00775, partial [Gemmatimonadetes bacterium]|nr:hypothetical protein [Gemmatimonadota bacterium]
PIVDVQSTLRQRVMDAETITVLPTGRNMFNLGVLIPGVVITTGGNASQDVGGALGPETRALGIHGGDTNDQRFTMNGVSLSSMIGGGWGGGAIPNATGVSEITFDTSSVSAELATGGVRINFIAREGGNRYSGVLFGTFANDGMQASNLSSDLLARNPLLSNIGGIDKNWDFNPGFGGPLKEDEIWFYFSGRWQGANQFAPAMFFNKNFNNPNVWDYEPDLSRPASIEKTWLDAQLRLTWQAAPKHKIGLTYTQQDFCACHDQISATQAPEAGRDRRFPTQRVVLLDWTAPMTSRVLIEASGIHRVERWGNMHVQTKGDELLPVMIGVNEQGGAIPGLNYRGRVGNYNNSWNNNFHWRFNVSYITGAHAFKFGVNDAYGSYENLTYVLNPLSYRFRNGVPNRFTMQALPDLQRNHVDQDFGLFAQDKWTVDRMTISLGVRYDHFANTFPAQQLGPTVFTPDRNLSIPETSNLSYHDITPKIGLAYDLFGNGRTALKVSLNKYLTGLGTTGALTSGPNPIAVLSRSANRAWVDGNGNYRPDCDLLNLAAQDNRAAGGDLCGAASAQDFGSVRPNTRFDSDLLTGWGKRYHNWEFSTGVQHELVPRVSLEVSYFRRSYGNFDVIDNQAVAASDFDTYSVTVPNDSRLANAGQTISGFKNVNAAGFGQTDNYRTRAKNYGKETEHWNGVDVNLSARMANGLILQGGTSTGRTSTNNCEILAALPEVSPAGLPYCDQAQNFLTQVKASAAYTIPRVDVLLSGTFQSLPGPEVQANYAVPNALVAPSLGRPLAGNAANTTVNLVEPGTLFGERLNQFDLRIGKIFRLGGTRTTLNFDIYNLFNANPVLSQNNTYSPVVGDVARWQVPTLILQARFVKIGAQFDF